MSWNCHKYKKKCSNYRSKRFYIQQLNRLKWNFINEATVLCICTCRSSKVRVWHLIHTVNFPNFDRTHRTPNFDSFFFRKRYVVIEMVKIFKNSALLACIHIFLMSDVCSHDNRMNWVFVLRLQQSLMCFWRRFSTRDKILLYKVEESVFQHPNNL